MVKFREYLKMFTYIFYPGIVFILYLAQVVEGKLGQDLIFCPTDLVVMGLILGIYLLLEKFKMFDKFSFMKKDNGKIKIPYLLIFIVVLTLLMGLYDDLKVYFYLNGEVSINLLIVGGIWLVLLLICYLFNRQKGN